MYDIVVVFLFLVAQTQQNEQTPSPSVSLATGEIDRYTSYIQVSWTPPSNVTIVTYSIRYGRTDGRTANQTITIDAPATSTRLNDLKPFANFTVFVRVNTRHGAGQWSEPKTIRTPVGSSIKSCKITSLHAISSTSIYIAWKPLFDPELTNGIVIRWAVLAIDLGTRILSFVDAKAPINVLNQTLTGLKKYKSYQVIVLPETARGFNIMPQMLSSSDAIRTLEDVPSRGPGNLSSNLLCKQYALNVEWSPLQTMYINGKLRGYQVLINQDNSHYKNLTVTNNKLTLPLDECKNYSVQVAAMTTPGAGKYARNDVITTCPCGPPVPLYPMRTVVAKAGQHLTLPCKYKGRPEPTVIWIKTNNGQRHEVSAMFKNDTAVQMTDSGLYVCVLKNTYGTAETSVRLIVARDVVVIHFQVVITNFEFTDELKDKTSQVSRQLESNVTHVILQRFHEVSVKNVKAIDVQQFRPGSVKADLVLFVTVDNSFEKKQISKQIKDFLVKTFYRSTMASDGMIIGNLTFRDPPGPPVDVKITSRKTTSIQVSWSPPEYHYIYGITSYSIQHRKPASKDWIKGKIVPGHQLSGKVEDLEPNSKYEVLVVAYNKYGEGKSSSITVETKADMTTIIALAVVIPLFAVVLAIGAVIWMRQRKKRRSIEEQLAMEQREKQALEKKKATMFNLDVLLSGSNDDMLDRKWREIPRESVEILEHLGAGAFGEVKRAKLHENGGVMCAVKMLKAQASKEEIRDLINELNIMATVGEHPNIISLIGACSDDDPLWIIVKFAENGSLYDYLQSLASSDDSDLPDITKLTNIEKLKLAYGIANGMAYLEQKRCVHRDLAARNVLLGKNNQPMVSDFGMSRDVYESGQYEKTSGGKVPIRWMAIESIKDYVFTTQSDVWSFGVVLWEVETLGKIPYAGLNGFDILPYLKDGHRLDKPQHCSQFIHNIMLECWQEQPKQRPKFKQLVETLHTTLKDEGCGAFLQAISEQAGHSYDQVNIDKSFLIEHAPITVELPKEDTNGRNENMYI